MDFVALTLPEAAYLYTGLALQATLRGTLRFVPAVLMIVMTLRLLGEGGLQGDRRLLGRVTSYVMTSALILVLFWPEAVGRFAGLSVTVQPELVGSAVALNDPRARVRTALDTGLVPTSLLGGRILPTGFRLLLQAFTQTHLALAQALHAQAARPLSAVVPMQWLLTQQLSGEAQAAVADWVHGCYLPAQARVLQQHAGTVTFADLLPWGASPLLTTLGSLEVTPGAQTGMGGLLVRFLALVGGPVTVPTVRCDAYFVTIAQRVLEWLDSQTTQGGTPLSRLFANELGIEREDQARLLLYREMTRAAGSLIPAPSLTGAYLGLRGVAFLGHITQGAIVGTKKLGGTGAGAGAAAGAVEGLANEAQRVLDGATSLVGLALWLTWWGPYIVGIIHLVLLGLFPIVVLWSLIPQAQLQPLALYFAALFFTTATPLWWALVDLAARLTQAGVGAPTSWWQVPGQWAQGLVLTYGVIALGLIVIPVVMGILIFGSFRAISGLWRGTP